MEAEAIAALRGFDGDDVPGVLGDDAGDDEIDFVLGGDVMSSPARTLRWAVRVNFTCTRHKRSR
jgi:hypothetical protein